MKVFHPRVMGPLGFSCLGGFLFFLAFLFIQKDKHSFPPKILPNSAVKRVSEQVCFLLGTQVLTFRF